MLAVASKKHDFTSAWIRRDRALSGLIELISVRVVAERKTSAFDIQGSWRICFEGGGRKQECVDDQFRVFPFQVGLELCRPSYTIYPSLNDLKQSFKHFEATYSQLNCVERALRGPERF